MTERQPDAALGPSTRGCWPARDQAANRPGPDREPMNRTTKSGHRRPASGPQDDRLRLRCRCV